MEKARIDLVDRQWLRTSERPFDPPLTDRGIRQAHALGLRLRDISPPIVGIYTSPFLRCVMTADNIANGLGEVCKAAITIEEGICEILEEGWYNIWDYDREDARAHCSSIELLKSKAELKEECSSRISLECESIFDMGPRKHNRSNLEDWRQVYERCGLVLATLVPKLSHGSIIVVTHGGIMEAFERLLMPDLPIIEHRYCTVSVLKETDDKKWDPEILVDDSHALHIE